MGELWAWGRNNYGQLGDGTTTNRTAPKRIGSATNWVSVAAGSSHSLAINDLGELWAWGNNSAGQLGVGSTTDKTTPVRIGSNTNWVNVSVGRGYALAINELGQLWAWGSNDFGQLGDGTTTNRTSPKRIGTATNWVNVSAGGYHSFAINSLGELWAWGSNFYGELGDGTATTQRTSPKRIGTATNWVDVSAGRGFHSLATNSLGELWSWGVNNYGQLGDWTTYRTYPVRIGTQTNWVSALTGYDNSFAINELGELWAWGRNNYGQLGLGDYNDRHAPAIVGFQVQSPNDATGYMVSAPSATNVFSGGSFDFTITVDAGYILSRIEFTSQNGKLNYTGVNIMDNTTTVTISNVSGIITAADFTITVSRIQ